MKKNFFKLNKTAALKDCSTEGLQHRSTGFTIVEMFLVTMIIAVLTAIGGNLFLKERDRFVFNDALSKTLQLIKTARSDATSSMPVYVDTDTFKGNVIPADGYGVHIKLDKERGKSVLTVFANLGPGPTKINYQNDNEPLVLDANDRILETWTLPKQIIFKNLIFDGVDQWKKDPPSEKGPTAFEAIIIFKPPLADTLLVNNVGGELDELALLFINPEGPLGSAKECQRIIINRVKEFPELIYEKCTP